MMGLQRKTIEQLLYSCFVFFTLGFNGVQAKEGDTFRPFINVESFYDDNLFRYETRAEAEEGDQSFDDWVTELKTGIDLAWNKRAHAITGIFLNTQTYYDRNSPLNYQANEVALNWKLSHPNRFLVSLGGSRKESLADPDDDSELTRSGVIEYTEQRSGELRYFISPRWYLSALLKETRNGYEGVTTNSNRDDIYLELNAFYLSPTFAEASITWSRLAFVYPGRTFKPNQPDYLLVDKAAELYMLYSKFTSFLFKNTTVSLSFGAQALENRNLTENNYLDWYGTFIWTWSQSEKVRHDWTFAYQMYPSELYNTLYVRSKTASWFINWEINARQKVLLIYNFLNEAYEDREQADAQPLVEDTQSGELVWYYQPKEYLKFESGVEFDNRFSNTESRDYQSTRYKMNITLIW